MLLAVVLAVDVSTGSIKAIVPKDGPLRYFGHDHVVVAPKFEGKVKLSSASASRELVVDAKALRADEPAARKSEGWKELKAKDRAEIEASMRGPKVLDVDKHPVMRLRSTSIEPVAGEKDLWMLTGEFSLRGSTGHVEFPVTMKQDGEARWFSGYVRLRPSEFGIQPFSVFGGAVSVKDEAIVRFNVRAK